MQRELKTILVFADWFEPGYKAGGPIRSTLHFVQKMKDRYRIAVLTTDRDLYATSAYENIEVGKWTRFEEGVDIFYIPPHQLSWNFILKQIRALAPDFIYLNSMYSTYFAVYPLLMRRLGLVNQRVVLSPRGMLRESALRFHNTKKRIFLSALRAAGIRKLVRFHATDLTEQQDIQKYFGRKASIVLAPNFGGSVKPYPGNTGKKKSELAIIFVGRVHPIKNLDYLLHLLPQVNGKLLLTIVGSEEDKSYAANCKSQVAGYPENITVHFAGEMPNHQLPGLIGQHHIFALPTRGENFGHAIFEALSLGKPVAISDQTPWRDLTAIKAGWDIDLAKPGEFVKALQQACDFDQEQYNEWSYAAWRHAADFAAQPDVKQLYYNLFQ